jgi:serine/threonine protein kinase
MSKKYLQSGDVIGSWKLDTYIDKGGNAHVWEVTNSAGERRAIKFLQRHILEQRRQPKGAKQVARFLREITFYREHAGEPGILPLVDSSLPQEPSLEDPPWLVTQIAVSTSKAFSEESRSLGSIVRALARVARTLANLHHRSIFHRDIKPSNLFLLGDEAVVGDFGLVELPEMEPLTDTSELVGPWLYVAPEMFSGGVDAGPADVYSLAKTLWVLASGQRYPLLGEQRRDVPALRLSSYVRDARARLLDSLLEAATSTDPGRRPSMADFAKNLDDWLEEVSPVAPEDLSHLKAQLQASLDPSHRTVLKTAEHVQVAFNIAESLSQRVVQLAERIGEITPGCRLAKSETILNFMRSHSSIMHHGLVWGPRQGRCASLVSVGNNLPDELGTPDVHYWGGIGVQIAASGEVYVCAAHFSGIGRDYKDCIWADEDVCLQGTASLENAIQRLGNGLSQNLVRAITSFMERIHCCQPNRQ